MEVAVAGQVVLALVLLVSGAAKAVDPAGTRTAAAALGVPPALVGPTAVLLPGAELLTALLLLLAPNVGLLLTLLLLSAFTNAVVQTLRSGQRPLCRCFGSLGGAAISRRTVARNAVLLAVAFLGFVLGGGDLAAGPVAVGLLLGGGLLAWEVLDGRRAASADLAADLAALDASLQTSDDPGTPPVPAPAFEGPLLGGGTTTRDALLAAGKPLLLVVLSPGCGGCAALLPHVRRWARDHTDALTVAVLGLTSEGFVRNLVGDLPVPVIVDVTGSIRESLGVTGTPSAVLISADGNLVGGPAHSGNGVLHLLDAALAGAGAAPRAPDSITLDDVAAPVSGVDVEPADDGGAVLRDPVTGAELQLDRIGALVWSVLDEDSRLGDVAADVADAFGAPPDVVERDVLALAHALGAAGMLRGVRPAAPAAPPST